MEITKVLLSGMSTVYVLETPSEIGDLIFEANIIITLHDKFKRPHLYYIAEIKSYYRVAHLEIFEN